MSGDLKVIDPNLDPTITVSDCHFTPTVLPGHTVANTIITYETVPTNTSGFSTVLGPTIVRGKGLKFLAGKSIAGTFAGRTMNTTIDLFTPDSCLSVQIANINKLTPRNEVLLYEADGSFNLSFRLRSTYAAYLTRCLQRNPRRAGASVAFCHHPSQE